MQNLICEIDTIESSNFSNNKRILKMYDNAKKDSEYEIFTNKVRNNIECFLFKACLLDSINSQKLHDLSDYLNLVSRAINIAENRILNNNLLCDKNLLYVLFATKHILESILDTEFFNLTGGYKYPSDILEFGKGLYALSKEN